MFENIASYYNDIYLLLVTIASIAFAVSYRNKDNLDAEKFSDNTVRDLFIVLFFIFAIGLRPINKDFVDMMGYAMHYQMNLGTPFFFDWNVDNKLFDNLLAYWYGNRLGIANFFLLISAIFFGCSYIGIRRIFPKHALPAYLVFLAAFSTFSYATNGIKAGAAASIFIMALGFYDKKLICFALALVSWGFHHSMQVPVAALVMATFIKNAKVYYVIWGFCVLLSMAHVTFFQELFGGMTDDQGAGYLLVTEDATEGGIRFRPDFLLYSAAPVIIGYYYEIKRGFKTKIYSSILHLYMVANSIWMLCMYASFNNRIAYLSWFLYPIVVIYPFLYTENRDCKYRWFSNAMLYHLAFTLFMVIVYYGILHLGH